MSANDDVWRRPPPAAAGAGQGTGPALPPIARPAPRPEDAAWARPPGGRTVTDQPGAGGAGGAEPAGRPEYTGPPPSNPPPANWRPPVVAEPPTPGTLPAQDHDRLDVDEQAARTLTTGIGLVAGAILFVLLLVVCARALF